MIHIYNESWFSLLVKYNYFEAFLKVVVLFKEHGIIYDDLWCGDSEVNNAVIHCFRRLKTKKKNGGRIRQNISATHIDESQV